MATNVPQVTFGPTGFVAPSAAAVLAGVEADINAAFGNTLSFSPTTPQGQLASSEAAIIVDVNAIFTYYCNQVDPSYATGRMQDAIGRFYFLERDPSEPTALQIACVGAQGTVIPDNTTLNPATIQDDTGNLYVCTGGGTIPSGGSITLSFACTLPGPIPVPTANAVSIYRAIPGWDSVSVASGVEGVDVESRQAFELRRQDTVGGNSFGAIGSIIGAVAKVSGVIDYYGYNNNTAGSVTVAGVSIPAYSIYIAVSGGAAADIAQAILTKKGGGAPMAGTTTVTAYDNNPLYSSPVPYQISFTIPKPLQVLFKVTIVNGPLVPSDAAVQVQNALLAAFTQGVIANNPQVVPGLRARIGSVIYPTSYIQAINALGSWAQVAAIGAGSANTPDAVFAGHIVGNTLTVTSVTSGAVATGQFLTDQLRRIINGTQIVSGSGSSWTVNNPQTVAGASFTGTGSGTNLTVTAVTGTIGDGDVIAGTGVPGGTLIVNQVSGTPGGAGVYVTNAVTTASGAAITANAVIDGSTADQTLVAVQANQEPQLVAANIVVVTS